MAEPPAPSRPEYRPTETDASAYLKAGALDEPPIPIGTIEPEYPADRQGQQPEGRVVLRVLINEDGRVDRVIVEEAAAGLGQFGISATDAFLAARFHPARKGGLPVKSQLLVEVQYAHER